MPLVDHDHMVQAFSANAADHPFRITVLPRTPSRYRNLPDTQSINSRGEVVSVDPITIPHQVARHSVVGKGLHELLCRPRGSRVFGDIEMQNTSTVMRKDDENVQHPKLQSRNGEEVDSDHLADVISKKGHPGLRWLARLLGHPARHRTFRDREPQFFSIHHVCEVLPMWDWRSPWCGSAFESRRQSAADPVVSIATTSTNIVRTDCDARMLQFPAARIS